MGIVLRAISAAAGEALRAGRTPPEVRVAADYPTEFSAGVGRHAADGGGLGPFFLHRSEDDVVERIIGHTPLDRPASGRVLEKARLRSTAEGPASRDARSRH